ncbi:PadR family transcriptional regulator [Modestobacter muralis]|nr:PadR family transcriptional regulator [Modestobacter muralis]
MSSTTLAVLAAFLNAAPAPRYGLELMREADVKSGSLYPILDRLEDEGWVVGQWEETTAQAAGRPRRRYYQLTALGVISATQEVQRVRARLGAAGGSIAAQPAGFGVLS